MERVAVKMNKNGVGYMTLDDFQMHLFNEGRYHHSYNIMGAHINECRGKKGVSFNVWAPNAKAVRVVGDFNNWNGSGFDMKRVKKSGIWNIFIEGLGQGDIYKYEVKAQNGKKTLKSDPYAFFSEKSPNTASKIVSLEGYGWGDGKWMGEKKKKDQYSLPMNIYELHLGSWKTRNDGSFYTYREIADELCEYLKDMKYTHVELMPITEHPFGGSWGYQSTGYYSVTSRYGTPQDFMYFVDKCHQSGIGVILDWVPGHFCKDEHGLYRFDGTPTYEYKSMIKGEHPEWGTANFDLGRTEVQSFLISNAIFWFDMYHIDGMRVDAVANMLYLNYCREDGQWEPNRYGGCENIEAVEFLRSLNKAVFSYHPHALMIAEESTAWPLVTAPTYLGGLGFNYKWNMGWMNDMLKYMEIDPIHRKWNHNLITFSLTYAFSENYVLPLSHDEVVHGKKSLLDKMPGDYWQKFAGLRMFYAYMFAHPGKKLIFMGGEFGQFIEWDYKKELDWFLTEYDMHSKLMDYVRKLNGIYIDEKSLWEKDHQQEGFEWIDLHNYEESVIAFMRKGSEEGEFLIGVFNFTPVERFGYRIGVPNMGEYEVVMTSNDIEFGGNGRGTCESICSQDLAWNNQKYSVELDIGPLTAIYIKLKKDMRASNPNKL
ncbi:1,4-alpha-glucan branching protein GlgB [Peptoclostridium litorale]|nr:1,4-alpha-glucan branching protein GlgB [Peptoclostridium litorale]